MRVDLFGSYNELTFRDITLAARTGGRASLPGTHDIDAEHRAVLAIYETLAAHLDRRVKGGRSIKPFVVTKSHTIGFTSKDMLDISIFDQGYGAVRLGSVVSHWSWSAAAGQLSHVVRELNTNRGVNTNPNMPARLLIAQFLNTGRRLGGIKKHLILCWDGVVFTSTIIKEKRDGTIF